MTSAFVRQLGNQPGVQLNPIKDRTDGAVLGVFDQTAALVGRFTRGRIDRPFRVNRSNLQTLLGKPASISLSLLNEAYVHAYEALKNGARELVVSRLSVPGAVNSWATFTSAVASTFAVTATAPTTGVVFGLRHLGCHNDGIRIMVHADAKSVAGSPVANNEVTVRVLDADGIELHRIKGSLDSASKDEFGQSNFLPDVSASLTDLLEWTIIAAATIAPTHDGYGKDASGADKWATSAVLATFAEGGTGYVAADYDRAIAAITTANEDFGYIMGGGTRAVSLITKLADLGFETNRQFVFDVPGDLTVDGAIAFVQSLGFGTLGRDHYPQAYFAPLKSLDPINGNKVIFGTSGAQVGFRCARNAQTNAYGLPPKNQAIAGLAGNLGRAQVQQVLQLTESQLSDLAAARINPVIYQRFSAGGIYAFSDSLTCANTVKSYRKLITVAEMSAHIDEMVARVGRDCLQLPMEQAIKRMSDFLERFFGHCLASAWLVESDDPDLPPFAYTVQRNAAQPADRMDVEYRLHYDGVARQVVVQQSIV